MLFSILGSCCYAIEKPSEDHVIQSFARMILGAVIAGLHIYGESITPILEHYGEFLSCGKTCVRFVRISALIVLSLVSCLGYYEP